MSAPAVPGFRHLYSGKVRDMYEPEDGPPDRVLIVASDRISAFDHALTPDIPDKGRVLTALSLWWFEQLADVVPNHVISTDVPDAVNGRAVLCEKLDMMPFECVVRGYLAGSGLADYRKTGQVCGIELPEGLDDGSQLPEPIFTPAAKAQQGGHDANVTFAHMAQTLGADLATTLRDLTIAVYQRGESIARGRGIILADTKLEFGTRPDGTIVLADELLTPDSSRFWPAELWEPRHAQPSFDKQFVRDWLTSPESGWDRSSEPPPLPPDIVQRTRERYVDAYERISGHVIAT